MIMDCPVLSFRNVWFDNVHHKANSTRNGDSEAILLVMYLKEFV